MFAQGALAQTPPTVFLEDLTWTELRDRIAAGTTTVLVPIGGTEQNGPHMTLGKHNVRARALAGKIAAALGNAVVAPVLAYAPEGSVNPPTSHMRFPGTITVSDAAFEAVLESAGAEPQARRISRHRVPGRSRRVQEGPAGGRGASQWRVEGHAASAPMRSRSITR